MGGLDRVQRQSQPGSDIHCYILYFVSHNTHGSDPRDKDLYSAGGIDRRKLFDSGNKILVSNSVDRHFDCRNLLCDFSDIDLFVSIQLKSKTSEVAPFFGASDVLILFQHLHHIPAAYPVDPAAVDSASAEI